MQQSVSVVRLVDCRLVWFHSREASWQSTKTYNTYQLSHVHTLLPPDDGQLPSQKHVEVQWLNKLKLNSASTCFHYTRFLWFFFSLSRKMRERKTQLAFVTFLPNSFSTRHSAFILHFHEER
jgi:hypothetical protein